MNDSSTIKESSSESSSANLLVDSRRDERRQSGLPRLLRSFLLIVGIPTISAILYYGLIASDIFVSEAKYAIRTSDAVPSAGLLTGAYEFNLEVGICTCHLKLLKPLLDASLASDYHQ